MARRDRHKEIGSRQKNKEIGSPEEEISSRALSHVTSSSQFLCEI